MANTIFSGDRVRALRAALQLNTAATIASGSVDPTAVAPGISLSVGSIYLSTSTGKIYTKHTTSANDTNFYEVQTSDSIAALAADVADLVTLSGVAANSTDLGTFTGTTIPDNSDIKEALQALETEVETKAADADVIKKDGSVDFTADQSMNGFNLTDLAAPVNLNDAARKAYVDDSISPVATDVADLVTLSGVAANSTTLGTFTGTTIPDSSDIKEALQALETEVELKLDASEKGAANGVATLDSGGKVPVTQLPNSVMEYLGTWAASTNTPTLANGVGNAGDVYIASDAGTVNFGAGSITFAAGDWVIYSGAVWQKSINSNAVASVNGYTGVVVLDTADITEDTNLYFTEPRVLATDLAGFTSGAGSVSAADTILDAVEKLDGNNLETQADVDDLVTLSGVAVNSTDLGTFTGTTIPDNSDIKEALQSLETSTEGKANTSLNNLTSTAINQNLVPDVDQTRILGTNGLAWASVRSTNYSTKNTQVTYTGDTTSGSAVITNIADTSAIVVGQDVKGSGIPDGAFILSKTATTVTFAAFGAGVATATATGVSFTSSYIYTANTDVRTGTLPSGDVLIRSGNVEDGKSGTVTFRSGTVNLASGSSGSTYIRTGSLVSSTASGTSGPVYVQSGSVAGASATGSSGDININSGDANAGDSGNILISTGNSTSGTRGSVSLTGLGISLESLTGDINVLSNKIVNLATPTIGTDAATKAYVDAAVAGGGGATTELDNLTTTAINASLNPDTNETYDLGTSSLKWDELYARAANLESALISQSSGGQLEISAGSTEKLTIEFVEATKVLNLQHSSTGNLNILATGTGANLTLVSNDEDVSIDAGGNVVIDATGVINFSAKALTNIADPTVGTDAASKSYVDNSSAQGSSDLTLVAGDTIAADITSTHQIIVVQGNAAGTVTLSATPFGTGTAKNGQLITLIGNSASNLIQIDNNNAAKGCVMNASWVGGQYDSITFLYSSVLDRYVEIARNN